MRKSILLGLSALALCAANAHAGPAPVGDIEFDDDDPAIVDPQGTGGLDPSIGTFPEAAFGPSNTKFGNQPSGDKRIARSFSGFTDYDVRLFGFGVVPPDTMGAVGNSQFVQSINGAFAVFDKRTGHLQGATSDTNFWNQLGLDGTGGDPRILYNKEQNRWIALAFGANPKDLNIAVSDTSNALGNWKATQFQALAPLGTDPRTGQPLTTLADYPTLAYDNNAVYIGTNNFAQATAGGPTSFRGTSLFVIPYGDVFNAAGPTVSNVKIFNQPVTGNPADDRGFAIQGVNSTESTDGVAGIVARSLYYYASIAYDVKNAGTPGATQTDFQYVDFDYRGPAAARQPGLPGNPTLRNIDTLDGRISSSAWELNGRTYFVQTVRPENVDYDVVRLVVMDSATKAVIQTVNIGQVGYDYYQGSLAVSPEGKIVIAYNRSGYDPATGRIGIYAQIFRVRGDGSVVASGSEIKIKESDTPGYINGAAEATGVPAGRQRWGDYSAVTLDPNDSSVFWLIGEYAREPYTVARPPYPNPASGFSRWGQWIAAVETPEPGTMAPLFAGLAALALRARRTRRA